MPHPKLFEDPLLTKCHPFKCLVYYLIVTSSTDLLQHILSIDDYMEPLRCIFFKHGKLGTCQTSAFFFLRAPLSQNVLCWKIL